MPDNVAERPDNPPFKWCVDCWMPALGQMAGVRYDLLFTDLDVIERAYRIGVPRVQELFGLDVKISNPGWSHMTYGHVNALGCKLIFPENSDVGHVPAYASLSEGINALAKNIDFTRQGMFPFYLDLWEKLKKTFPDQHIPFAGFEAEGPLTTAWLLRGHDFFLDIYDDPPAAQQFLAAVTESVIAYKQLIASLNGQPTFSAEGAFIADDGASMIGPDLWSELVVPYLDRYFRKMTSGGRSAHIENLTIAHLKYLDELGMTFFDPSVSPKLTAETVRDNCRVPFMWRLNAMQLRDMSEPQIERWVYNSAGAGAIELYFHIERSVCNEPCARKVKTFVQTAKRVEQLLADGCRREELLRKKDQLS